MASNIKVAHNVSSDGAIITGFRFVDAPTVTLGGEGDGSNPLPTVNRIVAIVDRKEHDPFIFYDAGVELRSLYTINDFYV